MPAEFWPALIGCIRKAATRQDQTREETEVAHEQSVWKKGKGFQVPELEAQWVDSDCWIPET